MDCRCILCKHFAAHFINLSKSFKLQQNAKNKACIECTVEMHARICRSLVEKGSMCGVKIGPRILSIHKAWSYTGPRILSEREAYIKI